MLFGFRPKTFPMPLGNGADARLFARCLHGLGEGFWKNLPRRILLSNLLYLQMSACLFFVYFCRCTSFVCLLNIAVECVFNFQRWGYFFYAQAESIAYEKCWETIKCLSCFMGFMGSQFKTQRYNKNMRYSWKKH